MAVYKKPLSFMMKELDSGLLSCHSADVKEAVKQTICIMSSSIRVHWPLLPKPHRASSRVTAATGRIYSSACLLHTNSTNTHRQIKYLSCYVILQSIKSQYLWICTFKGNIINALGHDSAGILGISLGELSHAFPSNEQNWTPEMCWVHLAYWKTTGKWAHRIKVHLLMNSLDNFTNKHNLAASISCISIEETLCRGYLTTEQYV